MAIKYKLSGKSLTSLTDKELNGIALTQKTSNGYPTYAIAQTFIPQHTGWISKVAMQINFFVVLISQIIGYEA